MPTWVRVLNSTRVFAFFLYLLQNLTNAIHSVVYDVTVNSETPMVLRKCIHRIGAYVFASAYNIKRDCSMMCNLPYISV